MDVKDGIHMDVKEKLLKKYGVEESSVVTAVGIIRAKVWNESVHLRLDVVDFELDALSQRRR